MTEHRRFSPDAVDPKNGYPIVWQSPSNSKNTLRNMVQVPMEDTITLRYKRKGGALFELTPTPSTDWTLEGTIKPYDVRNLGLPVSYLADPQGKPALNPEDIERLSDFGLLQATEDPQTWSASLWLPEVSILTFLYNVWVPEPGQETQTAPSYRLRDHKGAFRLLPQKVTADVTERRPAPTTLAVIRKQV